MSFTSFLRIVYKDNRRIEQKKLAIYSEHTADYFQFYDDSRRLQIHLRRRSDYPTAYCSVNTHQGAWFGYGARYPGENDEALRVHVAPTGAIRIERDMYCALPLFYGYSEGIFVVSNQYDEVCSLLPRLTLAPDAVRSYLWSPFPLLQTMWQEVGILGARETLTLEHGKLHKIAAPPRSWKYSSELMAVDPKNFADLLENRLEQFVATRMTGARVGFEVSGGMDSGLLPLYLAKLGYIVRMPAGSLVVPPPEAERQMQKLAALEQQAPLHIFRTALNPASDHPLSILLEGHPLRPRYILHELYEKGVQRIATHLQQQGTTLVVRGIGGDQLFEYIPRPDNYAPASPLRPPPFLKGTFRGENVIFDHAGKDILAFSHPLEQLASANIYIEHDIWPVSPFHDQVLYNFCQSLSFGLRTNKNILRAYFAANHFPAIIYQGPNESFEQFFNQSMLQPLYSQLIEACAERSVTDQLGLIDSILLRRTYADIYANSQNPEPLMAIHNWLYTEIELQLRLLGDRSQVS